MSPLRLAGVVLGLTLIVACSAKQVPARQRSASTRAILAGPSNTAAYQPTAQTFRCQVDAGSTIQWMEYATNPTGSVISSGNDLLPGHPNYARYQLTVDEPNGQYDLTITSTVVADGGLYECTDGTTDGKRSAQLVVIAGPPSCTTTIPANGIVDVGIHYTIECELDFHSSVGIAPLVTWTGPGAFTPVYHAYTDRVLFGVGFDADKTMDASRFTALMNFTQSGFGGPNEASNIPTWSDTWQSQMIFVYYGPENVYYSPVKDSYEIGDTITCYADASPLPTYKWTDLVTLVDYDSQTITLTESMVGPLLLRCQVANVVSSFNVWVNSTVNPRTTPPSTTIPPSTTTVPPVSNCPDPTGRWEFVRSPTSKAILCLYVDIEQNGYVSGLLWNDTETEAYYMEIMGRTRNNVFDETGFIGIWPLEVGVSAFAAECHRCNGEETLLVNPLSRSSKDNEFCGSAGVLLHGPQYTFTRVPPSYPCASGTTWREMRTVSREAAARRLKRQAQHGLP